MSKSSPSKTQRRYSDEDATYWEKHFLQFAASKQTRKAYCRANGVDYDRFQYWYHKLNVNPSPEVTKAIPVRLKPLSSPQSTLCTVECSSGALLRVHDAQALQMVLTWLS